MYLWLWEHGTKFLTEYVFILFFSLWKGLQCAMQFIYIYFFFSFIWTKLLKAHRLFPLNDIQFYVLKKVAKFKHVQRSLNISQKNQAVCKLNQIAVLLFFFSTFQLQLLSVSVCVFVWFNPMSVFPIRQWSVQGNVWQTINDTHKLSNFTESSRYDWAVSYRICQTFLSRYKAQMDFQELCVVLTMTVHWWPIMRLLSFTTVA